MQDGHERVVTFDRLVRLDARWVAGCPRAVLHFLGIQLNLALLNRRFQPLLWKSVKNQAEMAMTQIT